MENDVSILVSNRFHSSCPFLIPIHHLPTFLKSKIDSVNDIFSIVYPHQKLHWDLDSTQLFLDIYLDPPSTPRSLSLYIPQFLVFYILWNENACTQETLCYYLPFMKEYMVSVLDSMSSCLHLTKDQKWTLCIPHEELHLRPIRYSMSGSHSCPSQEPLLEKTYRAKCQVLHHIKKYKKTTITDLVSHFSHISNLTDILVDLSSKEFISVCENEIIQYLP
jgi:hypothetical protein